MSLILCVVAVILFVIDGIRTRSLVSWGLAALALAICITPVAATFARLG